MKKIIFSVLVTCLFMGINCSVQATTISVIDNPTFTGPNLGGTQSGHRAYDNSNNLAYSGIIPVVSSTIPVWNQYHDQQFINDGYYGNGKSWIGNSANSWLKIDLGSAFIIDSISFGRDRLGYFDDRDPGQFTIEVSLSDNVFSNGDTSNDSTEYIIIVDSSTLSFSGIINGNDGILTSFTPVQARYIKMTFASDGACIDEVEVFGTPIPEPTTLLLLGTGLAGIAGATRRRKKNQG